MSCGATISNNSGLVNKNLFDYFTVLKKKMNNIESRKGQRNTKNISKFDQKSSKYYSKKQ